VIASTPAALASHVTTLGPAGLRRSLGPGKWPVSSILCHLADAELAFGFRLRQALAEPHHVIQPFDQDAWSNSYPSLDIGAALDTFSAVRRWNLAFIKTVPKESYSRPVTHPERGQMTFQVLLETMAGHDINHLHQIESIAAAAA
jgi:hypothetical protein